MFYQQRIKTIINLLNQHSETYELVHLLIHDPRRADEIFEEQADVFASIFYHDNGVYWEGFEFAVENTFQELESEIKKLKEDIEIKIRIAKQE